MLMKPHSQIFIEKKSQFQIKTLCAEKFEV